MTRRYLKLAIVGSIFHPQRLRAAKRNPPDEPEREHAEQRDDPAQPANGQNYPAKRAECEIEQRRIPAAGGENAGPSQSQIGTLRMSLLNIAPDGDGTRLTLRIRGESNDPLPAFSATVASGQISGTTDSYQEVNVQNQLISAPASVLAPSDVDIPLRLNGVTPEQVGFVRIHDIQPANTP